MTITVRDFHEDDYAQWLPLWDGNNQGHKNESVTEETWNRIISPIFPVHGLGAYEDGKLVALLHYVLHPVTGHIDPVCYMQDVYVDPDHRRKGVARTLVEYLAAIGQEQDWARIYWLAEQDNTAAQSLYKNVGIKLDFTLHVMPL